MSFDTKKEMYTWIRSNWRVEIVYRGSVITNMKSAGTKNCNLCMQERIKLLYAFHKKKTPNNNLMNSRTETRLARASRQIPRFWENNTMQPRNANA